LDGTTLDALGQSRQVSASEFHAHYPRYRKSSLPETAFLCTPKGEKFRLHFGGGSLRNHSADLRGVPIHLYLYKWPLLGVLGDGRPSSTCTGCSRTRS
jgi:hypothetical protein